MLKSNITDSGMFRDHLGKKGLGDGSISLYGDVAEEFLTEYDELDNLDLYNTFLKEHAYDKRSYYYFHAIRSFIKWKITDNALKALLLKNLIRPRNLDPVKPTINLSLKKREEIIRNMASEKHRIIAKIQNQTAARIGDLLKLKRGSISYESFQGNLTMKIDIIGKRGRRNTKWIFDRVLQDDITSYIKEHYNDSNYYFVDFERTHNNSTEYTIIRTNYNWYWQDLKQACIRSGVNKDAWATHDFRRNVAGEIYTDPEMGKDPKLLQDFLGHANISTTVRYIKQSGFSNREVALKLSSRSTR